jgi:hypothetical protein
MDTISTDKYLYELKDDKIDRTILLKFDYFKNLDKMIKSVGSDEDPFAILSELSSEELDLFRKFVYNQFSPDHEETCSKDAFLRFIEFLNYLTIDSKHYTAIVCRYVYNHRDDTDLVYKTAEIHHSYLLLQIKESTNKQITSLFCVINNIPLELRWHEKRDRLKLVDPVGYYTCCLCRRTKSVISEQEAEEGIEIVKSHHDAGSRLGTHYYAVILFYYPNNEEDAIKLFKENWEKHKFYPSLFEYNSILYNRKDKSVALSTKYLWDEYRCTNSFSVYTLCLFQGLGISSEPETAFDLIQQYNGIQCPLILTQLATYYCCGLSGKCEKDIAKAKQIVWQAWEDYKWRDSLLLCAEILRNNEHDSASAEQLCELGHEVYKYKKCLYKLIDYLLSGNEEKKLRARRLIDKHRLHNRYLVNHND